MKRIDPASLGVFLILMGSYAYFWQTRDWNISSRLMLTYSMVDRGTVELTGLHQHTLDLAQYQGRYYSDKLPGYALLAAVPYGVARGVFGFPAHPLNSRADDYVHWPADYWVTLATSGLLSAATAVLLVSLARQLGCRPAIAAMVGLAYGLSTPAYVYATLAYGHQATAFALLASFLLIWRRSPRFGWGMARLAASGFLAASAAVIEIQVGPVSAILGFFLLAEVLGRRQSPAGLVAFAVGALVPTLALLKYNMLAFGSPWDMGYFHHVTFSHVHTKSNPLGLEEPKSWKLQRLLVSPYRGLFVFAPILILALPGWIVLTIRRCWALTISSILICTTVMLVNLSYPEWTGGWSTGPRLLVPLIPFAMIPVAALVAGRGRWVTFAAIIAGGLAVAGGLEMFLFQGAGGRIPHEIRFYPLAQPLRDAVWPLWVQGKSPYVEGFARNLFSIAFPTWVASLPPRARFVQMLPLAIAQVVAIGLLLKWLAGCELNVPEPTPPTDGPTPSGEVCL